MAKHKAIMLSFLYLETLSKTILTNSGIGVTASIPIGSLMECIDIVTTAFVVKNIFVFNFLRKFHSIFILFNILKKSNKCKMLLTYLSIYYYYSNSSLETRAF